MTTRETSRGPRSTPSRRLRNLGIVLLLVIMAAVVACVLTVRELWQADSDTVEFELTKTLMQALLIVLVGAVLTFVGTQYQAGQADVEDHRADELKQTAHRRAVLVSVLERTTANYNMIKQARRLLRARSRRCTGSRTVILREPYDTIMAQISETQLSLETLANEVRTSTTLFSSPSDLTALFDGLEHHLGELVAEYESKMPSYGRRAHRVLSEFPVLRAFLEKGPIEDFSPKYHAVEKLLRRDLQP